MALFLAVPPVGERKRRKERGCGRGVGCRSNGCGERRGSARERWAKRAVRGRECSWAGRVSARRLLRIFQKIFLLF